MIGKDYKALRYTRWFLLLSITCTALYVLASAVLVYAWGPYTACQAGRCYNHDNWMFILEMFGWWHATWLLCCIALFYAVWSWEVPRPGEEPSHYQKWLMPEEDHIFGTAGRPQDLPGWSHTDIQVHQHTPSISEKKD